MLNSDEIVVINSGPEQQPFRVPANLLAEHSGYFRKQLETSKNGTKERTIVISDVERDVLNIFVNWLYSPQKDTIDWTNTANGTRNDSKSTTPTPGEVDVDLVQALVLADQLEAPEFKRTVNNYYVNVLIYNRAPPDYDAVAYAFAHFPPDHPITRLMIDADAIYRNGEFKQDPRLSTEFKYRRTRKAQEVRDGEIQDLRACSYHEHSSDVERERCDAQCAQWK